MIDCHAHFASESFDADRARVAARARETGVHTILVVGEDGEDNRRVAGVCEQSPDDGPRLLPCYGLHPDRFADEGSPPTREHIDAVKHAIRADAGRLAAIGEIGLDRWWVKGDERRRAQVALLEELAALGVELDLPLNVHSRSAGRDTIDLLLGVGARRVLMHAFDGRASHAVRGAEAGYYFSIPPSVVRSAQKQKLVRRLPLESLLLESDSPVLGPEPKKRNEPANVAYCRDYIAQAHGVSAERVVEVTDANARRLFGAL